MNLLHEYIREILVENNQILENEILQEGMFQDLMSKIKDKGKNALTATKEFFKNLKQEWGETKEGAVILKKMVMGEYLTPDENEALKQQIKDLAKGIPLLALVILPGGGVGTLVLVKMAKKFGIDLMPTAFSESE